MRRVLVVVVGAVAGVTLFGGVAFSAKNPPVQLQGKVTNKGEKTVKKGKITIEQDDYYFKPTFTKAKPGSSVTVKLENEGQQQHTFTIPSLGIDTMLDPGKTATVDVTLPTDGALGYFCTLHGPNGTQGDFGMQGAFFSKKGESLSTGAAGATPSTAATPTTAASSSSGGGSGY
jgi:plastocyanin